MANKTLELALRVVAEATGKQNLTELIGELRGIASSADEANPAAAKLANELDQLGDQSDLIRSFEQSKRELEEQEVAVYAAATALEKLQRDAKDTDKPFVDLGRSLDAAEKDLAQLRQELTEQHSAHQALQARLTRSGIDTDNLRVAKRQLAAQCDRTGRAVDDLTRDMREGSAAQQAHAASLGNVAGQVAALATAYVGLDRVAQAVGDVFRTGDKFEKLGVQMSALMGSIEGGETATEWVKEFTKNTPLQLGEVSQAFVRLKAFGLDPMDGTLQAITDSALKLGGSFEEVEGISLALGQAWAKQKLQGEEILQLVERGVPVWEMLEQATGKNVQELQKLSTAGKLGRDTIAALIDEMGRASEGSAAAQMALFSGQVSNARDNVEQFYNLIAQSGAMDWLKGQLTDINEQFAEMAADGRLQEWAQSISDTIVTTGEAIKATGETLYEYREEIATVAKVWLALKVGSYFSNVIQGTTAAITAFAQYRAAIVTATAATEAATVAAGKFNKMAAGIGRAGLYTVLISELIDLGGEYGNLLNIEAKLAQSQRDAAIQARILADEFKYISDQTRLNITNQEQLEDALERGLIIMDEATGAYLNMADHQAKLAASASEAAEAERQRQDMLALSLPQALNVIQTLEQQAQNLDGVRDGVDGFIQSIQSARTAVQGAGAQYQSQLAVLDALEAKFTEHNESLKRQAYLANDVGAAYKELGMTAGQALTEAAERAQGAFELIQQSNEPVALQRDAFLAWADAAVAAASATDQTVPASVQAAAAALGLTTELQKLVAQANKLKPVVDTNSEAVKRYQREIAATNEAMATNQRVIESATASTEDKAKATKALSEQQVRLMDLTEDLTTVQDLEVSTLSELRQEKERLNSEVMQLNARYEHGRITAEEYTYQKERLGEMLRTVDGLLGDYKHAQDEATKSTERNTRATREQSRANTENARSLAEQRRALDQVAQSASRASSAYSSYGSSSGSTGGASSYATPNVSGASRSVSTFDLRAQKEKQNHERMVRAEYDRFVRNINNASSNNALNEVYKRLNQQLTYVGRAQKSELNAMIRARRDALKAARQAERDARAAQQSQTQQSQPTTPSRPQTRSSTSESQSLSDTQINELVRSLKALTKTLGGDGNAMQRIELALPGGVNVEAFMREHAAEILVEELEKLKATL